jgi:Leucine-rich repeat (LRR) protein
LPSLRKLVLTKNKVAAIEGFPRLPSLQHVVLNENQLADLKQLDNLKVNPTLRQLDMVENPITTEKADGFKLEVLIRLNDTLSQLRRLNDEEVTDEDVTNAKTEKQARKDAEEAARKEAEENARREAAEKAAAAEGGAEAEAPAE